MAIAHIPMSYGQVVPLVTESSTTAVCIYAHHNIIIVDNTGDGIIVYNVIGDIVYRCTARQASTTINISAPGVYIVKVGAWTRKILLL